MRTIVRNVVLVLAFAGYAWLFFLQIQEGGAAMWIVVLGCPLVLISAWATGRQQKRNQAKRVALASRLEPLVGHPPFVNMDDRDKETFRFALSHGAGFETLPAEWQSAIRDAERNPRSDSPPPDPAPVPRQPAPEPPGVARPPPDALAAPDRASFRPRVPPLLLLLILPLVYPLIILALALEEPGAEDASIWLASAGIVLVLVVGAAIRMFRMRIDIDADGLRVVNFWTTRVIPWESVHDIRLDVPRWARPAFFALAVATAAAGASDSEEDPTPSGIRILYSESEGGPSDSIIASATLWLDPRHHRRYQEALATLSRHWEKQ